MSNKTDIKIENPFLAAERVTICRYSDREVCQVIKRTKTTMTLRAMKATLLNGCNSGEPDALKFTPGGFCGHTSGIQRWKLEEDKDGAVYIARLQRKPVISRPIGRPATGRVSYKVGGHSPVIFGEHQNYDFNF